MIAATSSYIITCKKLSSETIKTEHIFVEYKKITEIINSFPPKSVKNTTFVILLCLTPGYFTLSNARLFYCLTPDYFTV